MALSAKQQLRFWGIAFAVLIAVLWLLGGTLLPFLLGAGIAYFLDPLADRIERLGANRLVATTVIAFVGVLVLIGILVFAVPALIWQLQGLVGAIPEYIANLSALLARRYPEVFGEDSRVLRNLGGLETMIRDSGGTVLNQVLVGSLQVLNFLVVIFVTPVVAFYLLLDWDRMMARVNAWLPREHAVTIRGLAREIDVVLAGFVRGQISVCIILGLFYAAALWAIGLQYSILVGLVAGLISFVPYIGSTVGLILSVGIALFQFWDDKVWIVATAGIFLFGQFVEGNILAPNLIGKSVSLHPVWLILALAVFGTLFGFAGLLVAVPVAAALGVIGRFLVDQYLASPMYTGRVPPERGPGASSSSSTCRRGPRSGGRRSSSHRRTGSRWRSSRAGRAGQGGGLR
jgi:predicted PurR-regulated permease PerM